MRSVPVLTAVIIGAAAVIAGCGQQHPGSGVAAPAPAASSSHSVAGCANASPAAQPSKLTITAADNGRSFCVTRGTSVTVFLKGTQVRKWSPIRASSTVLQQQFRLGHARVRRDPGIPGDRDGRRLAQRDQGTTRQVVLQRNSVVAL